VGQGWYRDTSCPYFGHSDSGKLMLPGVFLPVKLDGRVAMGISVRKLFSLFVLIAFFWVIPAKAGTCTDGVNARLRQLNASVTNCKYVDYTAGSDSNSGDDESNPWKHMPGMTGWTVSLTSPTDNCTGNCASFSPGAGTALILKGGTVWPYTVFPLTFCPGYASGGGTCSGSWGGSGSTSTFGCQGPGCMVIGVDPTWNQGTVNAITMTRDLGGCKGAPVVTISGGGGSGAAAHAVMIPPTVVSDSNASFAGGIAYIQIDSPGNGYISNPDVTISGSGCRPQAAVADITRAIWDYGLNSGYVFKQTGNAFQHGPMWTGGGGGNYGIIDSIETRNLLTDPTTVSALGVFQDNMGHSTDANIWSHNYKENACVQGQSEGEDGINTNANGAHEVRDSFTSNGEQLQVGPAGFCGVSAGHPWVYGSGGMNMAQGWYHNNRIWLSRWMFRGGSQSGDFIVESNEAWFNVYSCCGGHVNDFYMTINNGATGYEISNFTHDDVGGSSNQIPQSNGAQWYIFNNLRVNTGGGSPPWGIDIATGPTSAPAFMTFYNNTVVNPAQPMFVNGNAGPNGSSLTVTMQNNHCINCTAGFYGPGTAGIRWRNELGQTSPAQISASQVVQSAAAASSQGYTLANLYAPSSPSVSTVTFQGINLIGKALSTATFGLQQLSRDIVCNPRAAASISWNAGAFQYTGKPNSPCNLGVAVQ
jgi:hypothetical protein